MKIKKIKKNEKYYVIKTETIDLYIQINYIIAYFIF